MMIHGQTQQEEASSHVNHPTNFLSGAIANDTISSPDMHV